MSEAVKVLVVDDDEKARDRMIELMRFADVQVVGESTLGAAAYTWAAQLEVDVVLVGLAELLARALRTVESLAVGDHSWPVIGISDQGDRDTTRKAIVAGVRDFLVRPVAPEELRRAILNVHQIESTRRAARAQGVPSGRLGTIVTVFGVKGGIGKSTIATNFGAALASETKQHVVLCDLDLHFGDAAVMLDVVATQSIAEAARQMDPRKPHQIDPFLLHHPSRLKLLAAPPTPQAASNLTADRIGQLLEQLAATNDYVVVDTSAQLDAVSAAAMVLSTLVLLVVVPEVPCIRRTKAALALMEESGYSRDKVKVVINRTARKSEVSVAEIEEALRYPIHAQIPDDKAIARSISVGVPLVMTHPKAKAGQALLALSRGLAGMEAAPKRTRSFRWPLLNRGDAPTSAHPVRAGDILDAWQPVLAEPMSESAEESEQAPAPASLSLVREGRDDAFGRAATNPAESDGSPGAIGAGRS